MFDDFHILDHAQQLQTRPSARLGIAQHIAGPAEFQVGLGDFRAVKRSANHFETLRGVTASLGT